MTAETLSAIGKVVPIRRLFRSDFVRHSSLVFSATMAANVLNYVFNFAVSRRLGVENFAVLSSLVSLLTIISIPASVLTLVVVKYAATFHASADAKKIRRLAVVVLRLTIIVAIGALVVGLLMRGRIAAFLHIPDTSAITLCILITALSFVTPSLRGILQGEQDFRRYSISAVLEVFFRAAVAITLVYFGFNVDGAMLGWLIGSSIALLYTVWAVFSKHGIAPNTPVHLALDFERLLQTTVGVGFGSAFLVTLSYMDVLLVKHYFLPHDAGLYAALNLTGKIVLFFAGFVPAVVLPKAVAKSAAGADATALLVRAIAITLAMSGFAVMVFALAPSRMLGIIAGSQFTLAAPYVFQYDCAMALLALVTLIVNYRIGIHRFAFLYPLGAGLVAEILAIAAFHKSIWDIVHVLLLGNAMLLICCLYKISGPARSGHGERAGLTFVGG